MNSNKRQKRINTIVAKIKKVIKEWTEYLGSDVLPGDLRVCIDTLDDGWKDIEAQIVFLSALVPGEIDDCDLD